jgi:hypothetical protein
MAASYPHFFTAHIFPSSRVKQTSSLGLLDFEEEADRLSRNVGKQLSIKT